jgi:hypothetical protein
MAVSLLEALSDVNQPTCIRELDDT